MTTDESTIDPRLEAIQPIIVAARWGTLVNTWTADVGRLILAEIDALPTQVTS